MSEKKIKIAFIGDSFVGKSSLIKSYFGDEFSDVHISALTVKDEFEFRLNDVIHKIKLIDTMKATTIDFSTVDLIILCYSIENRISYRNIKAKWIEELRNIPNWPIPVILIATKIDLRQEFPDAFFITSYDGQTLSQDIKAMKFFEVSAKNKANMSQLIEQSVRILYPNVAKIEEKLQHFEESKNIPLSQKQQGSQRSIKMEKNSSCICC